MITFFQNIQSTDKPFYRSVMFALKRIKDGASRELIAHVRDEDDKDKRNELKKDLPCVLFSGKFAKRNTSGLIEHSGLICLDFDHMDNREELAADEFILACWLSPSGNGVKALVKIPGDDHYGSFLALEKRYPKLDRACKDVSRVCYESYDPDIWINEGAKVFKDRIEVSYESMTVDKPETDSSKIYEALKKWLTNRGVEFYEGNRNNYLFQLASACNRFGISRSDADRMMRWDFVHGGTQFSEREFDQLLDSCYVRYNSQFGTAHFEKSEIVEKESRTVISAEVLDVEAPAKDLISLEDVRGDMDEAFRNGIKKGETTYFPYIDYHFRWSRGELTVMHGYGNHGKSAFMNQLIHTKALKEDQRWCYFSPEQYPPTDFYFDFIQTHVGQTVMTGIYQMEEKDYNEAADWVKDHIYYIYPEKNNPTPEYILMRFKEMIIKHKIDGVVVDPFNQLYHDYSERDDKYLSKILTEFKRFALLNNIYFVIIAHPSGGAISLDELGNYKMPYYTKISGGMMWGNKCDNVLAYNRPYYRTDPSNTECHFASQKIKKQSRNGIPGMVVMHYDRDAYRFFQDDGFNPMVKPVSDRWWE